MSSVAVADLRALSSRMFGQRYRLELMNWIAELPEGIFCLKDACEGLGLVGSQLQAPLRDLVASGLLDPLPKGDSRKRYYLRQASLAWPFAQELSARS